MPVVVNVSIFTITSIGFNQFYHRKFTPNEKCQYMSVKTCAKLNSRLTKNELK